MNSLLAEILVEKRKEVDRIRERGVSTNRDKSILPIRDFKAAISVPGKINLIAEIKFASPSTGIIHARKDPLKIGQIYEAAGAAAISLLTDNKFFGGDLNYLPRLKKAISLPILRKDFIIDKIQVIESFLYGAGMKREKKKALIPFITAGDPDLVTTRDLIFTFEECGAHIIELGVPFSDPLADGPVIQTASLRALSQGIDLKKILALVDEVRQRTDIPLILMTYYNPVYQFGLEKLARQASMAGVDGFIIPDLPPEEGAEWMELTKANNLDVIFLVAPNTPLSRAKFVASKTNGFLYAVSVTGITGKREGIPEGLINYLNMLRSITDKPLVVGFGISSPSQVKALAPFVDGFIVGSALIRYIARYGTDKDLSPRIVSFVSSLVKGISVKPS